jgi:drug/metabolite transporter (DMT)-like permease
MTDPSQRKAVLFALLAVLFWSTSPTAFKLALSHQSIYQLLTGASLTSTVVLGAIVLAGERRKQLASMTWGTAGFSALMGVLNPVAYYLILFRAYSILPAQVAQPLNMIWPIVLVLISIPLLRHSVSWKSLMAMLLSFSGVVVVSLQDGTGSGDPENRLGIILALSTSVIWAFYFLLNARDRTDPVVRLFLNFLFATLYLLAGGIWAGPVLPASTAGWATAVYVGIFEMGITFVLWLMAIRAAPATDKISNLVYLAPFINLGLVRLILKEQIFGSTVIGIILLVGGILIQNLLKRDEPPG